LVTRDYKQKPARISKGASWMSLLVGLLSGLVIGLAIAFVVAWYVNKMPNPFSQKPNGGATAPRPELPRQESARIETAPKSEPKAESKTDPKAAGKTDQKIAKTEDNRPRFDFYKILPGSEETLSDQDLKRAGQKSALPPAKEAYFLQAGAFQNAADADNMKARLALMGMEASIQTAAVPDKGMLHRVRLGPFGSVDELNKARNALKENGVQATPVKVSEGPGR
jgi:cell division protein FtsN